jgi:hypothetical protein
VRKSVRTGVEVVPLPSRGVIVCGYASSPVTDLIAYSNHMYGKHHKAFEVPIAEPEASFQPRECVFCDPSLRSKRLGSSTSLLPGTLRTRSTQKPSSSSLARQTYARSSSTLSARRASAVSQKRMLRWWLNPSASSPPLVRYTSTSINLTETDRGAEKPSDKPNEKPLDTSDSRE